MKDTDNAVAALSVRVTKNAKLFTITEQNCHLGAACARAPLLFSLFRGSISRQQANLARN